MGWEVNMAAALKKGPARIPSEIRYKLFVQLVKEANCWMFRDRWKNGALSIKIRRIPGDLRPVLTELADELSSRSPSVPYRFLFHNIPLKRSTPAPKQESVINETLNRTLVAEHQRSTIDSRTETVLSAAFTQVGD